MNRKEGYSRGKRQFNQHTDRRANAKKYFIISRFDKYSLLMFRLLFIPRSLHPFASAAIKDCFLSDFLGWELECECMCGIHFWWSLSTPKFDGTSATNRNLE